MKQKMLAIMVTLVILAASTVSVLAYEGTGSVSITGGSLTASVGNIDLGNVTLDGSDQAATSLSTANSWTATDATGTGAGWNMTISSTNFEDASATPKVIDLTNTESEFKIQLLDTDITTAAGNTPPSSQVTTLTAFNSTPYKFLVASAGNGMGSYTLKPSFELEIPAETYVGSGTYTATVTVSINSGP